MHLWLHRSIEPCISHTDLLLSNAAEHLVIMTFSLSSRSVSVVPAAWRIPPCRSFNRKLSVRRVRIITDNKGRAVEAGGGGGSPGRAARARLSGALLLRWISGGSY